MKRTLLIEKMIEEKWKSKRKFAEHVGIPPTTLQSILKRGIGNASIDNVIRICKGLGITVDQLEDMSKENEDIIKEPSNVYLIDNVKKYKYLPISISAGLPINIDPIETTETISIPNELMGKYAGNKDIFITRICGDSMNKVMPDRSLIAVKPIESIKQLKDGDIVVFSNDYEYSVKRFYQYDDMIVFRPDSKDIRFSELRIPKSEIDDLQIHGKVVLYIVELD